MTYPSVARVRVRKALADVKSDKAGEKFTFPFSSKKARPRKRAAVDVRNVRAEGSHRLNS